jgi:acetyl-CoA synthetase
MPNTSTDAFRKARDFLFEHRDDYQAAYRGFQWPEFDEFNWALDWFDVFAKQNRTVGLRVFSDDGERDARAFPELSELSSRVANSLSGLGVKRGDRILVMLGNRVELWEIMLAAMKVGAVVIPATSQLTATDLQDRFARGAVKHVVTDALCTAKFHDIAGSYTRIIVGSTEKGWRPFDTLYDSGATFLPDGPTKADDPMLLYFTSGTTAKPKLVLHTHRSYPVGHLSTMYWIGCRPGDVHLNISSPGWAKHAWSSFFAPWNAEATVVALDHRRFVPSAAIAVVREAEVNTLCAPPTVWRLVVLDPLGERPKALREIVSAGEPLNPEVIEKVRGAWGITIRDGYGQTETTAQIGNTPGQTVKPGAMGRPLPGYRAALLLADGRETDEGEIALSLEPERPAGLMVGYLDNPERTTKATEKGFYRTGDEARCDASGYLFYIARTDDVFKSSDYRISPFELESALLEHSCVAEAAVVASPDPVRLAVPKAFVLLKPGIPSTKETADSIFAFLNQRLAPYKRIRRIEFTELPKTISGKIRRVELRRLEEERKKQDAMAVSEFENS